MTTSVLLTLLALGFAAPQAPAGNPPGSQARAQTPQRQVAITFDDLPKAGGSDNLKEIQSMTRRLLATLAANRVPAHGFVNESRLYVRGEVDARIDVLRSWLDAGLPLGNHTFSHPRFEDTPLDEYRDDVVRGDIVTRRLMAEKGMRGLYFRHPYTSTGPAREAKEALEAFLKARGYAIAPFTVEHSDFMFAKVYADVLARSDRELAARVRAAYLEFLDTAFEYFEGLSRRVLGYEVRQVFLIHANQINADCLDEMIRRLRRRGYSFISLERALEDKAYRIADAYVGPWGISWLHRWTVALGQPMDRRGDPDPPDFIRKLYSDHGLR